VKRTLDVSGREHSVAEAGLHVLGLTLHAAHDELVPNTPPLSYPWRMSPSH
jgi:hypothetical protein